MGEWTSEVEDILEKLRINCVNLSEYHRKRYYHFKSYGKWFRLPLDSISINQLNRISRITTINGTTNNFRYYLPVIGMFMGIISPLMNSI